MPTGDGPPYVDASKLPAPAPQYVVWLDLMGVQSIMSRSLPISANYIFKFHVAALDAKTADVDLFPVMDGIYALAVEQEAIKKFLRAVMERLCEAFCGEKDEKFKYVLRGGMAYGPVVRGADLKKDAVPRLAQESRYAETLLIGMPVIQAHVGERDAPPFGIFVNESARAFAAPNAMPFNEVWWRWYEPKHHAVAVRLRTALDQYYDWCEKHSMPLL